MDSFSLPNIRAPDIAKNIGTENLQNIDMNRYTQYCISVLLYVENRKKPFDAV